MPDRRRADVWTELLFQFALPCVQEAEGQLRSHHGATPRTVVPGDECVDGVFNNEGFKVFEQSKSAVIMVDIEPWAESC